MSEELILVKMNDAGQSMGSVPSLLTQTNANN